MCGLILSRGHRPDADVERALDLMAYRGDGEKGHKNIATMGAWKIGHVRLAIQDRSTSGNQPFADRSSIIAFVGEIFNHDGDEQQRMAQCVQAPFLFHNVDGFWAVVQTNGLTANVFTDHLGIKPLYYWPKQQIVCSEIEPMFALAPKPPLDETYLSNCIKFGYDYSGRTPYEGIYQIAPGRRLELGNTLTGETLPYWNWYHVPAKPKSLREIVQEAIENRLVGERPVAMLLSGGLDSSIIYYTLKDRGANIEAFSVENGESEFLPPGVITLNLPEVTAEQALSVMKTPLDLGSMIPQVQLARAIKAAGYHVCLTGDGADEVFGGYRRAQEYDSQASDIFCELPYYHLPRLDRVMMAATIELRSPFLAPEVIAYGLRLPYEFRTQKEALKHAFKGIVPDRIINRTKHPLKSSAVREGGLEYRRQLVKRFRQVQKAF